MNRLTITRTAAALLATALIGGTLVSVALASTAPAPRVSISDTISLEEASDSHVVVAVAAAASLGVTLEELNARLDAGASLAHLSAEREVGYGSVARSVNDTLAAHLDAALREGRLDEERVDEVASAVAAWIDAGGQPDADWLSILHVD